MAKTQLTPEEKAAREAAKKAAQETKDATGNDTGNKNVTPKDNNSQQSDAKKKNGKKGIYERIKIAFTNFPAVDKLYHDGNEVYFSQMKPEMTVVKRADVVK